MRHSNTLWMLAIVTAIFVLIFLNLVLGSVSIPLQSVWHIIWNSGNEPITWQNIIWKSRLPQALTALVAGAGLSISGLQMQTVFRNPLAGPSVLGISSVTVLSLLAEWMENRGWKTPFCTQRTKSSSSGAGPAKPPRRWIRSISTFPSTSA